VFFWSDGWLLNIASHNWGVAKFQGFHEKIRDIDGLNFNGRYFDRSFINEPDKKTWIKTANELQNRLTDEVIEKSIKNLPPEIFEIRGEEIIRKLKTRRDDLEIYAEEYYDFISKIVTVFGSNKKDHFVIERINAEQTKVTVYLLKTKTEEINRKVYERIFNRSETKEIQLYGFNENDKFDISGHDSNGIKIRIIGGKGKDSVNDQPSTSGKVNKTFLYDSKTNTSIVNASNIKDKTSDKDPLINDYNRKQFQYNVIAPIVYPGYNPDDGIFIGVGVMIKNQGFRKFPFKSRHMIKADIAPKSQSYDLSYTGTFTQAVGKWDFVINANIFAPSYTDYFYGFGNETKIDKEKFEIDNRYYSSRYVQYIFYPELERKSKNELHHYLIGG
ncbi:MAG: hypothetical protein KAI29_11490, partial [Cyclobacteriaceae bacterium]|nr:hypothetical protein [Cyclobacteriaceae bacterium]